MIDAMRIQIAAGAVEEGKPGIGQENAGEGEGTPFSCRETLFPVRLGIEAPPETAVWREEIAALRISNPEAPASASRQLALV